MRLLAPLCLAALLPGSVLAQEDAGGLRLEFGLSQRITATTDNDLTDRDRTPETAISTGLDAALISETRSERLAFGLGLGLELADGGVETRDPRLSLSYGRVGPGSALDLAVSWSQSDFETLRRDAVRFDEDGTPILPDDLDDLFGAGTRTARSAEASFRWGQEAPLGGSLGLRVGDLTYDGDGAPEDSRSATLSAGISAQLTPVSRAELTLSGTRTEEAGETRDTTRLALRYTLDRPLGAISVTASAVREEDEDPRLGLSFGRSYALPRLTLSGEVGVSEDGSGDPALTGRLALQYALPDGQIRVGLSRSVAVGDDDSDTTALSAAYARALTPLANLAVEFDYARTEDADGRLDTGSLSASLGYQLTPDWQARIGASANLRETDATGRQDAQSVFLVLDRRLTLRP